MAGFLHAQKGTLMDHQKIIRLRHQAADARELHEKAYVQPDELDALLDYALARIEGAS